MATVSLQAVFDEARRALEAGAADKAIGIAQHILVHYPRMIEGYRLLGEAYLNAGEAEQAAAAFEQVLQADPENVAAYYGLGLAQQNLDQRSAAITAFERALEIQPNLADLRTQLLRLYSETPGSAGQFRLSRAGLGRLYARGNMFSQAIDEFRAVLDADSDRDDVKVALAEALWRDGQEEEATEFCRGVLERQDDLHKPTLLQGYMLLATGRPEGEALWRRAAEQDAFLETAHALFDVMPQVRIEEPVLPEFDEAEWRAQEAQRAAMQPAQAPVTANAAEDDFFADSWLSGAESDAPSSNFARIYDAPSQEQPVGDDTSDDDLLASLLGFDSDAPDQADEPATEDFGSVQPFALDAWDSPTQSQTIDHAEVPNSLNEIGLEDSAQADQGVEGAVKPFSLDDWDFDTTDTSSSFAAQTTAQPEDDTSATPPVSPFALEDEVDNAAQAEPFTFDAQAGGNVQPFSFDADTQDQESFEPFSFEADAQDQAGVKPFSLDADSELENNVQPISFEDDSDIEAFSLPDVEQPSASDAPATNEAGLGNVQPFSFEDWGLDDVADDHAISAQNAQSSGTNAQGSNQLDDLAPFSLDDLALDATEDANSGLEGPESGVSEDAEAPRGFSWETPSWQTQQAPTGHANAADDDSIFAKLMRNRPADDQSAGEPVEAQGSDAEPAFFSFDDESLRFDDAVLSESNTSAGSIDQNIGEPIQAATQDDTASADSSTEADVPEAMIVSEDDQVASATQSLTEPNFSWEDDPALTTPTSDDTTPFSLSDLGLSDDDIAALDPAATLDAEQAANSNGDTTPFSLADLGLSDEEIAALEAEADDAFGSDPDARLEDQVEQLYVPTASDESDFVPFSLSELGLSDEEIALLNQQDDFDSTSSVATPQHNDQAVDLSASSADNADQNDLAASPTMAEPQEFGLDGEGWFAPIAEADSVVSDQDVSDTEASPTTEVPPMSMEDASTTDQAFSEEQTPFSLADLGLDNEFTFPEATSEEAFRTESDRYASGSQSDEVSAPLGSVGFEDAQDSTSTQDSAAESEVMQPAVTSGAMASAAGATNFQAQLVADPENHAMRLAVARMSYHMDDSAQALDQYKQLIKRGQLLDEVIVDLQDMIDDADEPQTLRRLHRLLGDVYMKQNRLPEAMAEYSWTFARQN